jgi:diguanylate cyclase (GGDEF)-like protein/PAS domain S-box-containing protein
MSRERIFIVEDERIIAIDLQRRLERLGYSVCGNATSGEEALTGIRQNHPDLVLMDIVIQGDMDGISVAIELKKELDIPVIFLSAYTDTKTIERAKDASPLGYILKPFKERELATILEMALYKRVADTQIKAKEEMFSAILNSTTDAILAIGHSGEILFLNPQAEQLLEATEQEAKKHEITELYTLSDLETGELFQIPRMTITSKVFRAPKVRLTNWKQHSFVVELSINREPSGSNSGMDFIISFKDITRLNEMTDTLKYQTSHDTLTGLLNRNELALRMNSTLIAVKQNEIAVSVLYIDIDYFKVINDSCGTMAGDVLLKETADRIRFMLAGKDFAARVDGDDFVLVHFENGSTGMQKPAIELAQALLDDRQAKPFRWNNKEYPVSLSIGIVALDPSFVNEHDIMVAGYQTVTGTHETGGNRHARFTRGENLSFNTVPVSEWISKIHEALQNDGFRLYFQPILPLDPANTHPKLEILLRMVDGDGSIIPPADFIPIAERYNLMPAVDRWVYSHSMQAFDRLRAQKKPLADSIFCINLSGSSLADENIIGYILDATEKYQVPADHICIEVTETNAILNLASASRFIRILKGRGFTIALDDFGSGFSSFNYLKNLPVDYLKIDGSFIRNMDNDKVDYNMVQAISSMCKVLGLSTIGEFAENDTIVSQLREIGVDYAQGYAISRPQSIDEQ